MNKKIKLFIVDTSQQILDYLEQIFYEHKETGIEIIGSALNYKNTVDSYREIREADVFLISAFLPDKMGIDLMNYLKSSVNQKGKYIVTVTGNTRNLVDEAIEKGADGYIQKPFSPRILVNKIYEVLKVKPVLETDEEFIQKDSKRKIYGDEVENEIFKVDNDDEEFEEDKDGNDELSIEEIDAAFKSKNVNKEEKKKKKVLQEFSLEEENDDDDDDDEFDLEENKVKREIVDLLSDSNGKNLFKHISIDKKNVEVPNKIVVFTSPKSIGKTSILVNVAASVKKHSEYEPRVIIIDMNLLYPSVTFKFHQDDLEFPKRNIYDLMDDIEDLDEEYLKKCIIHHAPTGIDILHTPFESIRDVSKVTAENISLLLFFLRKHYDLILIDTSSNIRDDSTVMPLVLADSNVVLFENELSSLLITRKFIDMMQLIEKEMNAEIIKKSLFILNRYSEASKLKKENVKKVILRIDDADLNIPVEIPEDSEMNKYSNYGQMLIDKNGETTNKINELASILYPFYMEDEIGDKKKVKKNSNSVFSKFKNIIKK